MKKKSRTEAVYINSTFSLFHQVLKIILTFIVRKIFVVELGVSYLGYNAVFANILDLLNLADLGIGVAVTSFLYMPLAKNDVNAVQALMCLYKKIYKYIGAAVFFLGFIISFFLPYLISDADICFSYIYIYYYVNLMGTVSTYYLAYKRTLLLADQRSYVISMADSFTCIAMSALQVLALHIFKSFLFYLVIKVVCSLFSNLMISFYCIRHYKYPYLSDKKQEDVYKPQIFSYVKDVFISRIGAYIYFGTDNIVISVVKGSLLAGFLSNYTLITFQINVIVTQIFSSIQGIFGNYVSLNSNVDSQKEMTNNYLLVNYLISNLCLLGIMFVIQPFEEIYLGHDYLLNESTVILLAIDLFLMILLQLPSQIFIIYKLFHYDRFIIIGSGLINIVISFLLVDQVGVDGVLIGTLIASIIYLFSRYYIISTKIFHTNKFYYIFRIFVYSFVSFLDVVVVGFAVRKISGGGMKLLIARLILSVMGAVAIPLLLLARTKEVYFLFRKFIPERLKKYFNVETAKRISFLCIIIFAFLSVRGLCLNNYEIGDGNKSLKRNICYTDEKLEIQYEKYVHVSLDDTIYLFEDLTTKQDVYQSIFDNSFLHWMKSIHDKYGTKFSCYVYYKDDSNDFTLSACTRKFKEEFVSNSDWLKFGFHSYDRNTSYGGNCSRVFADDYELVYLNLIEIAGNESIDHVVRLQGFNGGCEDIMKLLEKHPDYLFGLLTADDRRLSYYLNNTESEYIYCHDSMVKDGVVFISSDLRLEFIQDIDQKIDEFETDVWINQLNDLIIFTHEWAVDGSAKLKLDKLLQYAHDSNYGNAFPESVYEMN